MSLNTILATAPLATTGFHLKATGTTIGNSLIWDNGTNVGIGNTNTSYTLDVSGTFNTTSTTSLATSSGYVGLGISSPTNLLCVSKNLTGEAIALIANTSSTGFGLSIAAGLTTRYALAINDYANNAIARFLGNGNVLIGTTTDGGYRLNIEGTTGAFFTYGTSSTYFRIRPGAANGSVNLQFGATGGAAPDLIFSNDTNTTRFRISDAGVVTINALGSGTVTSTSGVLSAVSDMNLKIEDGFIDNALDKVLKLKPRYFYWNEKSNLPTNIRQLGFYAQEVNAALGEESANRPKNENDKWGIYDRGIIAMLTKAIQELSNRLIKLESK